jgi:type VI protein secretion system component Hcp
MAGRYYLQLGRADDQILGECREKNYVGWIELQAMSWGNSGRPGLFMQFKMGEFAGVKWADIASQPIQQASQNGRLFASALLEITKPRIYRFDFKNVMINSFQLGRGDSLDKRARPLEQFSMRYDSLDVGYNCVRRDDQLSTVLKALGITP